MNGKLELKQIENILGWSYPTVLKYANEHGELVDTGYGRGKWYVPIHLIEQEVEKMKQQTRNAEAMLKEYSQQKETK